MRIRKEIGGYYASGIESVRLETVFFHHPDELKEEILEAGFQLKKILPVESFGGLLPNFCE